MYKMLDYLEEQVVCRRRIQLNLLGEKFNPKNWNNQWDNCQRNLEYDEKERYEECRKIINVIEKLSYSDNKFTVNQMIDCLKGNSISTKVSFLVVLNTY